MSKFNGKKPSNKTVNLAGGIAYQHDARTELVFAVISTFLENKHYESGDERIERIVNLIGMVDDDFVAKLAVVARREFYLRSVSHLLVGELAKKHKGDDLVMRALIGIAERPDDLTEVVSYLGGCTKQVKRGIRHAILKFSPHQLAKYRASGKKTSLVDLFNLAHPNPKFANEGQKKAWKDLIDGNLKSTDTWESRLSSGEDKAKVWHDLVCENKIGYMALLRNLRNIDAQADVETKLIACQKISDSDAVSKSKQLPFRFYSAFRNVENTRMRDAITIALEHSVRNAPKFEGKTLVAVDCSGSMDGDPIQKAAIMAAILSKNSSADIVLYEESIRTLKYTTLSPTIELADKIISEANGGGTQTGLVFNFAQGKKYDRIIIISDNESWAEGGYGGSVQIEYEKIKAAGENPFIYAIDIQGYGTKDIKGDKIKHICGFSEKIFDFMQNFERKDELIKYIENFDIESIL